MFSDHRFQLTGTQRGAHKGSGVHVRNQFPTWQQRVAEESKKNRKGWDSDVKTSSCPLCFPSSPPCLLPSPSLSCSLTFPSSFFPSSSFLFLFLLFLLLLILLFPSSFPPSPILPNVHPLLFSLTQISSGDGIGVAGYQARRD